MHPGAPALIVAGDGNVITLTHTAAIYCHLPRAQFWVVPNSGHSTPVEHANEFNRKTDAFFQTRAIPARPH
ncbi:alpha/beta fold hydrolase [Hymenobacter nivis]|uniref:Alpha/beta hydrolase n=1 Tax=Hymenobacter nivis TaxID=1850093 RepID=A0A2Z3GHT3_9BACT|nr:alpha/beta hydrolase [Hymenobacter nivis]AWM32528.1 hypothetical protein DDQ68_06840 [Hymenobacter nivis]